MQHCNVQMYKYRPSLLLKHLRVCVCVCVYIYIYIGFNTFFYVVRHLDSIASYLPTSLHLGFFHSWPSFYLPSSFSLVFLVSSFVLASISMLLWVMFLLPESYAGGSVATGRATLAGQVKGEHPDKGRYTGPPGWGLG